MRAVAIDVAVRVVNAPNVSKATRDRADRIINSVFDVYETTDEAVRNATQKVAQNAGAALSGIVRP